LKGLLIINVGRRAAMLAAFDKKTGNVLRTGDEWGLVTPRVPEFYGKKRVGFAVAKVGRPTGGLISPIRP